MKMAADKAAGAAHQACSVQLQLQLTFTANSSNSSVGHHDSLKIYTELMPSQVSGFILP